MANPFQDVMTKLRAQINRLTKNRAILNLLGVRGVKLIQVRTSQGYGVDSDGGSKKLLAPLKASTIKSRKRRKKELASGVSPSKSRLTFTGQMIESITHKIANNKLVIYLKGKHRNSRLMNEELAAIHEDGKAGPKRRFMHFSQKEKDVLSGIARREIKKRLRKLF